MSDPAAIALVAGVAGVYLAFRYLPRWLLGFSASVGPEELHRCLEKGDPVLMVDVRTGSEFACDPGHIAGALNIPLPTLRARLRDPDTRRRLGDAAMLVAICRSDARAVVAVHLLRRAGCARARVLTGGMGAWEDAGFPVARGGD